MYAWDRSAVLWTLFRLEHGGEYWPLTPADGTGRQAEWSGMPVQSRDTAAARHAMYAVSYIDKRAFNSAIKSVRRPRARTDQYSHTWSVYGLNAY